MSNVKGVQVESKVADGGYVNLYSDFFVAKRNYKERNRYDVIAASFYGTRNDLNRVFRKSSQTSLMLKSFNQRYNDYKVSKSSDFDIEETKGEYRTRIVMVKKGNLMLDETNEESPIIIMRRADSGSLPKRVFELVRHSIVAPLFPDLTDPTKLSKELVISVEKAEEVLEGLEGKTEATNELEKITIDGINKYKQWVDYLFNKIYRNDKLRDLEVVVSGEEDIIAYELIINEKEIREYITTGIQTGKISISNKKVHANHYDRFDTYMGAFAPILKEVIESQSRPLHRNGVIREQTISLVNSLGRTPLSAQLDVIEAMSKSLAHQNKVDVVGEPGVGKTYMMLSAAYLDSYYSKKPMKALVLSPGHLVETTWEKEVRETLKDATFHHIKSVRKLRAYENKGYFTDDKHRVFILGQNDAKSGYNERPMVNWNKRRGVFQCPDCNKTVTKLIANENSSAYNEPRFLEVPVDFTHFATQRYNNRKCKECETVLWGANNKKRLGGGFKHFISEDELEEKNVYMYTKLGFLPRDARALKLELSKAVERHNKRSNKNTKARIARLREAEMVLEGTMPERNQISPYKVSISTYIKKKLRYKFSHLIIDELHEYQNMGSARTASAAELIASVAKVIRGTGTLMNGYAKSRFYNDFMMHPDKLKRAGFEFDDVDKYQVAFGVTEKRHRINSTGRRRAIASKEKPGISPIIFPMFLQDSTVFISMADLENDMPGFEHKVVPVEMSEELKDGKNELEKAVRQIARGNMSLFKSTMPLLSSYLDMPTIEKELKDEEGNVVYKTKVVDNENNAKMKELSSIIASESRMGRRTIVYTHYTSDGINNYIKRELEKEGYSVSVMNREGEDSISCDGTASRVKKDNRETYVKEEVSKGSEVLIVNPILVQTGTNLIDFHSIVYFQMSYQVYTIRQADRRTWRIGQTEDCTIYYLYYEKSFQEEVAKLMATKVIASESIEGNMDASGLEAISDDRTPEEELAKKFFDNMDF